MKVSQVIKSIKVSTKEWSVVSENNKRIVMSNSKGYYFVRFANFGGFKLISPLENVEMNYLETDVVAQQLWMYLVDVYLKH